LPGGTGGDRLVTEIADSCEGLGGNYQEIGFQGTFIEHQGSGVGLT
jgi:hypothetical protein